MEKQKPKNKKPSRTASQLRGTALAISFALLSVPTFCVWSLNLLRLIPMGNVSIGERFTFWIILLMPLIGFLTAIGTANYATKVMKLSRQSAVTLLTTITSATVMIMTFLLGIGAFFLTGVAIVGIITAIGTANYATKVMKLYRFSGVVSLTTIMSVSVMITTYLLGSGAFFLGIVATIGLVMVIGVAGYFNK